MWAIVAEGYCTKCEGVIERGDNENVHEVSSFSSGRKKPRDEDNEEGREFLNMAIVALEQDLRTVAARLHANGLKAVRRQVLDRTDLGSSDKDFLTRPGQCR